MFWTESPYATEVKPTPAAASTTKPQFFQEGNPRTGQKATVVPAHILNTLIAELLHILAEAGVTPDKFNDTQVLQAIKIIIGNMIEDSSSSGGDGGDSGSSNWNSSLVYPGAFHSFFEQTPPSGWMARNGALFSSADTRFPRLWKELLKPENQWRIRTEEQWQNQSASTPWNGIGGVPFFVLNTTMRTIRLPDTRGMYLEDAGFNGLTVGGVHGDGIRNFPGKFSATLYSARFAEASGPFSFEGFAGGDGGNVSAIETFRYSFDPSRAVPTAAVNQPKAFGVLGCVYVGTAE